MKLIYYIKDAGTMSPAVQIASTTGGLICFHWDQKRCAHIRVYDLSVGEEVKRLKSEQAQIFNQRLMWPIFTDIVFTEEDVVKDAKIAELEGDVAMLKAELAHLQIELEDARAPKRRKNSPIGEQAEPVNA